MDSGNGLRNTQCCGKTNSHTQITQPGLRQHRKMMLIIKAPAQNERLFRMEAVSSPEDAGGAGARSRTKQQPPNSAGALRSQRGHSFCLISLPCPRNAPWIWPPCAQISCWSIFSTTAMASTLQEKELISAAPNGSRNRPGKQYNDQSVDLSGMNRAEVPTPSLEHQRTKLLPFHIVFLFFPPLAFILKTGGCNIITGWCRANVW